MRMKMKMKMKMKEVGRGICTVEDEVGELMEEVVFG